MRTSAIVEFLKEGRFALPGVRLVRAPGADPV
jgi:hypothetical protein